MAPPKASQFHHTPGGTAAEQLQHRIVLAAGSSPFYDEPKAESIDRTQIVACPVEGCHKRFVNATFLERHQLDHAPRPKPTAAAEIDREHAVGLVVSTIGDRIASGELKAGRALSISGLAAELGVTRGRVEAAIEQLVRTGRLGYAGVGYARRCVVVG